MGLLQLMKLCLWALAFRHIGWTVKSLSLTEFRFLKPPRNQTISSSLSLYYKCKNNKSIPWWCRASCWAGFRCCDWFPFPCRIWISKYYLNLSGLLSLYAFYLVLNWLLPCWLVAGLLKATATPCGWYKGYPMRTLPYIICLGLEDAMTAPSWLCLLESSSPSISWMYAGIVSLLGGGGIATYGCYWMDVEYATL